MSFSFPKTVRLRYRSQFRRFARDGHFRAGERIIIEFRNGRGPQPRLGITVTRKYGKSHDRNRFKRLVRESFRLIQDRIQSGLEIHVKPRSGAYSASMNDIQQEMLVLLSDRCK